MIEGIFWLSLLLVAYANLGYPVLLWIVCRFRVRHISGGDFEGKWPRVSVVMVAHNEAGRIPAKLQNLLESDYPGELEVIVVCDGCEDETAEVNRRFGGERVRIIESDRCGKAEGLIREFRLPRVRLWSLRMCGRFSSRMPSENW